MRNHNRPALRCPHCGLPLRWCVCPAHADISTGLQVDVLMHQRERMRTSSTGRLIKRLLPAAGLWFWEPKQGVGDQPIRNPNRQLWILHPRGSPLPAKAAPENVQVLLLDGLWPETVAMAREVSALGQVVCLPMTGESRFWLRGQTDRRRHSTVEALLFLLRWFGLEAESDALQRQFELHVYASLRARGYKDLAQEYLRESPAREAFAELISQLDVRRPL
jgi:DTW domain-containing protein YfiP